MDKIFNLTKNTRKIGKLDDDSFYIVTNDETATLNDIYKLGAIMDSDNNITSPELPIGVFLKTEYWIKTDGKVLKNSNITKDALIGFAMGDAFGVPVEFLDRKTIRNLNIKGVMEYGTHNVPAGSWSDDTSMIVATMESLIQTNGEINYDDIMDKFIEWFDEAKYTSLNYTFGVGGIIYKSLMKYLKGEKALQCGGTGIRDNGNGSLMRILPISLYCIYNNLSFEETYKIINDASSITHAHDISKMSCLIYTEFLRKIIETKNKEEAFDYILSFDYSKLYSREAIKEFDQLLNPNFKKIKDSDIKESGYVVDTLESVIYSILNADDYKSTIMTSVNLGYDTDTVAGISGSIAGVLYGYDNIPKDWLVYLKKINYLIQLSTDFDKVLNKKKEITNLKNI